MYLDKFEEAEKFAKNRRIFQPAVYNAKRLDEYRSDVMFQEQQDMLFIDDPTTVRLQELMEEVRQLNSQVGVEDLTEQNEEDQFNATEPFEFDYDTPESPMETGTNDEVDDLSGTHRYINTAVGGRKYSVGVTIRATVLDLLRTWNESPIYSSAKYDYQFLQFLLVEAFGTIELAHRKLDKQKLDFVKGRNRRNSSCYFD